ncbi:MAG: hypothetical protein IPG55_02040 [Saprospiraceae bacterium]|nr:hypothetical protein [Candidatus Defluviibacterium haderslevense]MBK7244428.1 hypothetical protein [Candidatus Defluviibacterium haderslevense]
MNNEYIIYNLKEALEQLGATIKNLELDNTYDNGDYLVEMQHLYHHINTAWNARVSTKEESHNCIEQDFERWRQFPKDIYMGI